MKTFHAVTWQEGNFENSASVLSFNSKAARAAFPAQCSQRFEEISFNKKVNLISEGRMQRLMLWDANKPTEFVNA
jgi:hypothetical protein